MPEIVQRYVDLPGEDGWIEYLRLRLPYSFRKIGKKEGTKPIQYILSEPQLSTGLAEYHNFWRRGYVYYAVGKLIDVYHLPEYWKEYRSLHTDEIRLGLSGRLGPLVRSPDRVFNALQLEKLWKFVSEDPLDRERAVMTNLAQAIEFCLKSVKTHAEYRETATFTFNEGHDLKAIYDSLPDTLQVEMRRASVIFADDYAEHRKVMEGKVAQLMKQRRSTPDLEAWKSIVDEVDGTTYTVFVNENDPSSVGAVACKPEEWFDCALENIGRSTYHRYSPLEGRDPYPAEPIHLGLLLGRFIYEHLFPVTAVAKNHT